MTLRSVVMLSLAVALAAQPSHAASIVLEGGMVHTLAGEPIQGPVVIEDGVIRGVGPGTTIPDGATRINVTGLHVYPGLFDALGQIGLVEVNATAATVDHTELGRYNPHLRAATAIHPASEVIR